MAVQATDLVLEAFGHLIRHAEWRSPKIIGVESPAAAPMAMTLQISVWPLEL